ncbi:hypothetical protein C0993_005609 [Termitomyces sp. T159_Od127]|nr:hypothetical protein C0993_005609 [Termitomyces sp. T159_Od127]
MTLLAVKHIHGRKSTSSSSKIFTLPGVAHLLVQNDSAVSSDVFKVQDHDNTADLVSDILSQAGAHHVHASDTRLHIGPPCTVQTTSSSNKFNNLSRARQITLERQQKKVEAKLHEEEKGITIIAVLWRYDEKSKLVEAYLDELLQQVKDDYHKTNAEADELKWYV